MRGLFAAVRQTQALAARMAPLAASARVMRVMSARTVVTAAAGTHAGASESAGIRQATERLRRQLEGHSEALARIKGSDRLQSVDPSAVFCNRELRLNEIEMVGMDYDFTIACYRPALQSLIYTLARDHMVEEFGYKPELMALDYDPQFAIRGLAFDSRTGMLLKLDASLYFDEMCVFRGRRRLTRSEVQALYGGSCHISQRYADKHLRIMADLFCLPEATLLADIVDLHDRTGVPFDAGYVFEDTRSALNAIHSGQGRGGGLHKSITNDIGRYLDVDTTVFQVLTELRRAGKRTMLITNSGYDFVNAGMTYLMEKSAAELGAGKHWTAFFDIVICAAAKPSFFTAERTLRLLDRATGRLSWDRVTELKSGEVYLHGSVGLLHSMARLRPETVLYFGDNLPADLVSPARVHSWRTGAVVSELEGEIAIRNSEPFFVSTMRLRRMKATLAQISALKTTAPPAAQHAYDDAISALRDDHRAEEAAMMSLFNANFGSTFRCRDHMSYFASTVQRWSDVYMARVDQMLHYGAGNAFFPRPIRMQHEIAPHESRAL